MHKAYKRAILYFLLFSILLLVSSVMLFEHKIGFSATGVLNYYLGNEELFIPAKTISGLLKIIVPHIFVFALFSMVLLHFVVFTKKKSKLLVFVVFLSILLELFTPLLIVGGYEVFAYLKLLSFFVFELLVLYILWVLFISIVYE